MKLIQRNVEKHVLRVTGIIVFLSVVSLMGLAGCSEPPLNAFQLSSNSVVTSAISNNGRYGVVVTTKQGAAVWDLQQKKQLYLLKHPTKKRTNILHVAFSSDNNFLLTSKRKSIILWHTPTGKILANYNFDSPIQAIALSSDGQRALVGLLNAKALYIDLNEGDLLTSLSHTETVNSVALSVNGKYALTGSDDHYAVLWDLKKALVIHKLKHKKQVIHVAFSPDTKTILSCGAYDYARLWQLKTGQLKYKLNDKRFSLSSIRFSKDGKLLALGIFSGKIKLWHLKENHPKLEAQFQLAKPDFWRPSATIVNSLAFSNDLSEIVSLDSRGMATWWSL